MLRRLLDVLFWFASRMFALRVIRAGTIDMDDLDGDGARDDRPRIVLGRHAGPGDSFLLVREILTWTGRRPRIVLKSTLRIDPVIDVLLGRLPVAFVGPTAADREAAVRAVRELAETMGPDDALLIFPEGGNFTEGRRSKQIEHLRASGHDRAAERAESLHHVLAPRTGGVQQTLLARPDADVVVVAHTGLDRLTTVADIWAEIPVDKTLYVGWQVHRASEVPTDVDGLSDWLFDRWAEVDRWVGEVGDADRAAGRLEHDDVPPFDDVMPVDSGDRVGRRRGSAAP
jgi:1-acyl-sn-glycerol-3-phosphate acyltransferase